jgi:hypothetical protein
MKKRAWGILLLLACLAGLLMTGCSGGAESGLGSAGSETEKTLAVSGGAGQEPQEALPSGIVDVDLTRMSSTMVYGEVYNMMVSPDQYLGKRIKMSGPYNASFYEPTNQYYHFVIVEDATACCQQGIEFFWNGDHKYPADYPETETKIELTGVYESYEELGETYYHLVVDEVKVL